MFFSKPDFFTIFLNWVENTVKTSARKFRTPDFFRFFRLHRKFPFLNFMDTLWKANSKGNHRLYKWLVGQKPTEEDAKKFIMALNGEKISIVEQDDTIVSKVLVDKLNRYLKNYKLQAFKQYNPIRWHDFWDTLAKLFCYDPIFKRIQTKYPTC